MPCFSSGCMCCVVLCVIDQHSAAHHSCARVMHAQVPSLLAWSDRQTDTHLSCQGCLAGCLRDLAHFVDRLHGAFIGWLATYYAHIHT
mmetsp:Transcript_17543/g.49826  ORF Transcript_17543/g.49826 Transcript_17543/m.49826 type:complete len:88 (+) Transcript_17543:464-727(+)